MVHNNSSPDTPTSRFTTVQDNLNPKPNDYPFKDWLLTKERKAICLMTYGKIARKCKGIIPVSGMIKNQKRRKGDNLKSTEEYDPPMVHVETFKIKRYSFDTGQNFICVTKELMDALLLGRENGSRFRDMIRKEVDSGRWT
ncbi:hypothetical protein Tco_0583340 [Tanacetum coccineum]